MNVSIQLATGVDDRTHCGFVSAGGLNQCFMRSISHNIISFVYPKIIV